MLVRQIDDTLTLFASTSPSAETKQTSAPKPELKATTPPRSISPATSAGKTKRAPKSATRKHKADDDDDEEDETDARRRELNRKAAARCRQGKLNTIKTLSDELLGLQVAYRALFAQIVELDKEIFGVNYASREHVSAGCKGIKL